MKTKLKSRYRISELTDKNIDEANNVRLSSWLETYVNEDLGITREWIHERNQLQLTDDAKKKRLEQLTNPNFAGWVATDEMGKVVGVVAPYVDESGHLHVGSLYVNSEWHRKGVGGALMQKVISWCDPKNPIELGVATYNKRAKAFYQKWGFEEIPDSERLFANKIPEIMMIRKGDSDEV